MKKFFMVAAIAACSLAANAQMYVGGSLDVNYKSEKVGEGDAENTTSFNLLPEIGYKFSDKFEAAVELGIGTSKEGDEDAATTWSAGVYGRYNVVKIGSADLFGEAFFNYASTKAGEGDAQPTLKFGLRPGVKFPVSDKVSLVAKTSLFTYDIAGKDDPKTKTMNIGILNSVSLGVQIAF